MEKIILGRTLVAGMEKPVCESVMGKQWGRSKNNLKHLLLGLFYYYYELTSFYQAILVVSHVIYSLTHPVLCSLRNQSWNSDTLVAIYIFLFNISNIGAFGT